MRILVIVLALFGMSASADHSEPKIEAVTRDGRTIILYDNHKWEFVEYKSGDPEASALLSVVKVEEMDDACRLQFRMQNNLPYKIRSIVPRFSVFNHDDILYDAKSKSFTAIKPTRDQYGFLQFSIGCRDIKRILVHDAARCTMGDIDMFNEEEGQCLEHIYVKPTDLINISK